VKIEIDGDNLTIIAEALTDYGRQTRSAYLLKLAARIMREQGLSATANAIDAEADRMDVSRVEESSSLGGSGKIHG
jgi:hypothetical protein